MPTYVYACKDCGHNLEVQQSFADSSLTECPQCRGALRKKFNSVGVVFKGSGFYRTDSRSGSTVAPAAKDTSKEAAKPATTAAAASAPAASAASAS